MINKLKIVTLCSFALLFLLFSLFYAIGESGIEMPVSFAIGALLTLLSWRSERTNDK